MPQDMVPLARITPERRIVTVPPPSKRALTPRQKAAVIVRYLLTEGTSVPLAALPEHMQAALAEQMGQMRLIDRATLDDVVAEFLTELDSVGLAFPGGMPGREALCDALDRFAAEVRGYGTFNFLLSNGDCLFAHRATDLHYIIRRAPFPVAHLKDEDLSVDFSEVTTPDDRVALIATAPLTDNELWNPLPVGRVVLFFNGEYGGE